MQTKLLTVGVANVNRHIFLWPKLIWIQPEKKVINNIDENVILTQQILLYFLGSNHLPIVTGTVVVEPEPVEDNAYKGPDFSSNKKKVLGIYM